MQLTSVAHIARLKLFITKKLLFHTENLRDISHRAHVTIKMSKICLVRDKEWQFLTAQTISFFFRLSHLTKLSYLNSVFFLWGMKTCQLSKTVERSRIFIHSYILVALFRSKFYSSSKSLDFYRMARSSNSKKKTQVYVLN